MLQECLDAMTRFHLHSLSMKKKSPKPSWKTVFCGIVAACAVAVLKARAEDISTIEGQVFIRTQGAETIKLSLVEVQLFDEKVITEDVERKHKAAAPVDEHLQTLKREAAEVIRQTKDVHNRLSEQLPQRLSAARTPEEMFKYTNAIDAAIAANTEANLRSIDVEEKAYYIRSADYYFSGLPKPLQATQTDADGKFVFKAPIGTYVLVAVSTRNVGEKTEKYHWMVKVTTGLAKKIMLANDNLSSSGSPDSIITTFPYAPWEYPAYPAQLKLLIEKAGISSTGGKGRYWEQQQAADAQRRYLVSQLATPQIRNLESLGAFVAQDKQKRIAAGADEATKKEAAEAVRTAQRKAVELYPALGIADSPLNKEFVERVRMYRIEKKEFFAEPDWPMRLAKECSEALAAKPAPK
jgi:hypothetical protein